MLLLILPWDTWAVTFQGKLFWIFQIWCLTNLSFWGNLIFIYLWCFDTYIKHTQACYTHTEKINYVTFLSQLPCLPLPLNFSFKDGQGVVGKPRLLLQSLLRCLLRSDGQGRNSSIIDMCLHLQADSLDGNTIESIYG